MVLEETLQEAHDEHDTWPLEAQCLPPSCLTLHYEGLRHPSRE
jgi:hypothetical protein